MAQMINYGWKEFFFVYQNICQIHPNIRHLKHVHTVLYSYFPENPKDCKREVVLHAGSPNICVNLARTWLTAFPHPPVPIQSHHQLSAVSAGMAHTWSTQRGNHRRSNKISHCM